MRVNQRNMKTSVIIVLALACGVLELLYPQWRDFARAQGYYPVEVDIDIRPDSYPNCFNINGHGVIPVAILGSAEFNVDTIDTLTLSFAGLTPQIKENQGLLCYKEDVSGDFTSPEGAPDGYLDLVCQFEDDPSQWNPSNDDTAELTAELTGALLPEYGGILISGIDGICVTQDVTQ